MPHAPITLPPSLVRNPGCANYTPNARDRLILQWVLEHRFLTTDHIQAITGWRSRDKLNKHLRVLFDAKYLDRPASQHAVFSHAKRRVLVHALGHKGAKLCEQELGASLPASVYWSDKNRKVKSPDFILHTLGVSDFFVGLHQAAGMHEGLRLVRQPDVLAQSPTATQRLANPLSLPTEYRWFNGAMVQRSTVADGMFALVDSRSDKPRTAFHFFEYDGATMPILRTAANQSSIVQKMLGYADVYVRKLHFERFGYRNFRVLFVTHGRDRIASMLDAYNEHVRHLCPPGVFLFADYRDLFVQSTLGAVWVDGTGASVELVPDVEPRALDFRCSVPLAD